MVSLSKRWETVFYLVSGITISYCLRVNISVAAQEMRDELGWSETDKGFVLSSFYWGYAIGQVPASLLAGRIGAKWTFAYSILLPSLLSLLMPWACRLSLTAALFMRALLGLFASATFPSAFYFYPAWIPVNEKTSMVAAVGSGVYLGEIIGFSLSGYLVSHDMYVGDFNAGNWPAVFYLFGLVGILWFPLFVMNVFSSPDEHPTITQEEVALIKLDNEYFRVDYDDEKPVSAFEPLLPPQQRIQSTDNDRTLSRDHVSAFALENYIVHASEAQPSVEVTSLRNKHLTTAQIKANIPWLAFFVEPASIALLVVSWTSGWIAFMILSELPSYLTDELGYDLESAGFLSIAPYAANYISVLLFGHVFRHIQMRYQWSNRLVRQVAMVIALLGTGVCLLICGFLVKPELAYSVMVISLFLYGATHSGIACVYMEVTPNYSSVLNAIGNAVGAVSGIVSPILVALCTTRWPGAWGWRMVFFITFAQCLIAMIVWALFQTSDIVPRLNTPAIHCVVPEAKGDIDQV